ncbi:GreA/GreB family elongation factor [Galbibacter pacificus]|uniref:GreA/GreB family elongation factor n=1 Tax=Galbibacter pacificus TaxID=2996052 RepID=A0ABT6FRQ2_9FLAO|nr:GreA/GreB family elongation factor [Galbibacter pacificus]MDG3582933.1 GreA/GreB family elongation factor [Galbibacter pacificus]MDG3585948.1 GreA/GreB family elongation factor [Galbibacter pacificus]
MKKAILIVERIELAFLKKLAFESNYYNDVLLKESVRHLMEEFKDAVVVEEDSIPEDVIRLYSKVSVRLNNGWEKQFKIVLPKEGNLKEDLISVLSPMGIALYGHRKGDVFSWKFPLGKQQITILHVENIVRNQKTLEL